MNISKIQVGDKVDCYPVRGSHHLECDATVTKIHKTAKEIDIRSNGREFFRIPADEVVRITYVPPATPAQVTLNDEQELYVIPCKGGGFTCLGYDVCQKRIAALAAELKRIAVPFQSYLTTAARGTLDAYTNLSILQELAKQHNARTGYRFECELHPQLKGLEGKRVEVVNAEGETVKFYVGKSTGWIPCHLEIESRRSSGGGAVDSRPFKSVRVIGSK